MLATESASAARRYYQVASERTFKADLVKEARGEGAHVVVIAGSYLAGIPDLYVKYPDMVIGFWIELKYEEGPKKSYPVNLTPLQRAFLAKHRAVYGWGAWILGVRGPAGVWWTFGSAVDSPNRIRHDGSYLLHTKRRGDPWDLHYMLRRFIEHG